MKSYIATLIGLAAYTEGLVARTSICCTGLTVTSGSHAGVVAQLSDGQNRVGDTSLTAGYYCINEGGLVDRQGRGCILTPPTSQFQCDALAPPTKGFMIGCDGSVSQNGNTAFWICPTGDKGGYNIYKTPPTGQGGCEQVGLNADFCRSACPTSTPSCPQPPSSTTPPPTPFPTPSPKTCPTTLTQGQFEFPHLIIPVDSSKPTTAAGTSYFGTVTPTISTLFNFDIPWSDAGKTCSLIFDFPLQSALQTSSFTFSGSGAIDFTSLVAPADSNTSFAKQPAVAKDLGVLTVAPGNSYVVSTFACPAGQRVGYGMKSQSGTMLSYFQDYNPSPIGLYITTC